MKMALVRLGLYTRLIVGITPSEKRKKVKLINAHLQIVKIYNIIFSKYKQVKKQKRDLNWARETKAYLKNMVEFEMNLISKFGSICNQIEISDQKRFYLKCQQEDRLWHWLLEQLNSLD